MELKKGTGDYMEKITVVISVYNDEKFIAKSIESVRAQTYKNWELILVDDGSTDRSGEICDEYVREDERIRVIHQENRGYSGARNAGLDVAEGTYITFLDSDDFLEPDGLESLYKGIIEENADYAIGGVNVVYYTDKSRKKVEHVEKGVPENSYYFQMKDLAEAGRKLWKTCGPMYYCVWSRLFKMDIIRNYYLRFDTGLRLQEDVNFTFCYMYHADKVFVSNKVFYNYCREIDKDDTAEKPFLEQYLYVEESLINFQRIAYKFRLPVDYCHEMYQNLSEWFIKLAGKIYMESTGLEADKQKKQMSYLADSYIFRFFCEKLSVRDDFWASMKECLESSDMEKLYTVFGRKLEEGVIPPCQ